MRLVVNAEGRIRGVGRRTPRMSGTIPVRLHLLSTGARPIRAIIDIAKQSFSDWSEDGAPRLAAALAYYSAFSIAPLLFLLVTILGIVFADAGERVTAEVARLIGEDAAAFLNESAERSGPQGGWPCSSGSKRAYGRVS